MSFEQRHRWVDGLRRIPLAAVLHAAGASQDPLTIRPNGAPPKACCRSTE